MSKHRRKWDDSQSGQWRFFLENEKKSNKRLDTLPKSWYNITREWEKIERIPLKDVLRRPGLSEPQWRSHCRGRWLTRIGRLIRLPPYGIPHRVVTADWIQGSRVKRRPDRDFSGRIPAPLYYTSIKWGGKNWASFLIYKCNKYCLRKILVWIVKL